MKSSPLIRRSPANPLLTHQDVPYDCALVFNAGICKFEGKYVMVFRNDYGTDPEGWQNGAGFKGTNLGLAFSDDGVRWEVQPEPCWQWKDEEVRRVYDPRLTVIDGQVYMCFAVDTAHGLRGGIARTDDFHHFDVLSLSAPDNRNMVLFPGKVNGKYARFERPMPVYSRGKDLFDMWYADSPDLACWGNNQLVLGVEHFPSANDKVGPGAPPVKTEKGWLNTFHAVDRDNSRGKNGWEECWQKRYCAGIMLTDLEEPWRIIGLSREPLIAPETDYEAENGFRNNVIFPGGMILEDSGEVKIYYGGADTVECLASADVDDLIHACLDGGPL